MISLHPVKSTQFPFSVEHTSIANNLDCCSAPLWNEYMKIIVPGDPESICKLINSLKV